ncbi:MAG: hypothetical protein QOE19_1663, partial [Actinomycetota bacterium]|nr:hypothetical protein [Actinomycetota bacterium]
RPRLRFSMSVTSTTAAVSFLVSFRVSFRP